MVSLGSGASAPAAAAAAPASSAPETKTPIGVKPMATAMDARAGKSEPRKGQAKSKAKQSRRATDSDTDSSSDTGSQSSASSDSGSDSRARKRARPAKGRDEPRRSHHLPPVRASNRRVYTRNNLHRPSGRKTRKSKSPRGRDVRSAVVDLAEPAAAAAAAAPKRLVVEKKASTRSRTRIVASSEDSMAICKPAELASGGQGPSAPITPDTLFDAAFDNKQPEKLLSFAYFPDGYKDQIDSWKAAPRVPLPDGTVPQMPTALQLTAEFKQSAFEFVNKLKATTACVILDIGSCFELTRSTVQFNDERLFQMYELIDNFVHLFSNPVQSRWYTVRTWTDFTSNILFPCMTKRPYPRTIYLFNLILKNLPSNRLSVVYTIPRVTDPDRFDGSCNMYSQFVVPLMLRYLFGRKAVPADLAVTVRFVRALAKQSDGKELNAAYMAAQRPEWSLRQRRILMTVFVLPPKHSFLVFDYEKQPGAIGLLSAHPKEPYSPADLGGIGISYRSVAESTQTHHVGMMRRFDTGQSAPPPPRPPSISAVAAAAAAATASSASEDMAIDGAL